VSGGQAALFGTERVTDCDGFHEDSSKRERKKCGWTRAMLL